MEMDDLKKAWKQDERKPKINQNIMELIHQKSRGPLASLKKSFKRQMIAVAVLMSVVLINFAKSVDNGAAYMLFGLYLFFCLSLIAAFYVNYRLTGRMQNMDANVKQNLVKHVALLEKRLQWQSVGARGVLVIFIVLLEVLPLFYHVRMLSTWHSLPPLVRFSAYGAYLIFQYYLSRFVTQKKFGQHLARLKQLLHEVD